MKVHTSDYKNMVKTFGRELDSIISYELNGETIELGANDLYSITPHYEGSLLKSVMKVLEIETKIDIPLETNLSYQFGVKVNGEYEYINFGNYVVYSSEKQEDTGNYKITCYDKMLKSMIDYEDMQITYPITVRDYISAICNHLGLTFKNASDIFANYNRQIPNELYLDSDGNSLGYTFRDVLDELAQVTASIICINEEDDELEIRYPNNTGDTINEEYLKDINVNFGEKYGPINSIVLSRAEESDNVYLRDETSVAQNGLCEIKIKDNQIMNSNDRSDYLPDILRKLNGLEYYLNDFSSTGITYYELCDMYNIQIGEETYNCLMLNDEILITQGLEENIHTDLLETSETDYTKADKTDRRINQTYIMVDKQNGVIEELASKIIDVSATVSGIGQIQLENAHEGGLHKLSIKGAIQNLYPKNTENYGHPVYPSNTLVPKNGLTPSVNVPHPIGLLYPSSELYPRSMKLVIDETEYDLDIDYLNYINNTVCDEFIYEEGKCKIIRRVGTDSEGNMYALDDEVEETRNGIDLFVNSSSIIKMKSFTNAILSCEYLTQNEYTDVFATQVQLESEINQTAGRIEAKVSSVVDDDGNVTAGSIILAINRDESEATINADKIDLSANDIINLIAGNTINLTSKNIAINSDNFSVSSTGEVVANKFTSNDAEITGGTIDINTDTFLNGIYLHNNSSTLGLRLTGGTIRGIRNGAQTWAVSPTGYGSFSSLGTSGTLEVGLNGTFSCLGNATIQGNLTVSGTKNRVVEIENKEKVLLNAYETATPYFGDIGSGKTDENGYCKIDIEDIFSQTIEKDDYKVFIQECGDGKLYVEKYQDYFLVKGTKNLEFDWEIKAIQKGYKSVRLDKSDYKESDE